MDGREVAVADFICIVPPDRKITLPSEWVGKRIKVTISRPKASQRQRGWYWAYALPELMRECGYTESEAVSPDMQKGVHEGVLAKRFGTVTDRVTGNQIPAGRTAGQDTKQNAEWQDWFCWYCVSSHGLVLEFKSEAEWLARMK